MPRGRLKDLNKKFCTQNKEKREKIKTSGLKYAPIKDLLLSFELF